MRPSVDVYFMAMAFLVASRSTCARRAVGCVLTDDRNRVLATGYNGVPSGMTHCTDVPCPAAESAIGENLDACLAVHSEQNAVALCPDVSRIGTAYCTTRPCVSCQKLLINTSCRRIVYCLGYPDAGRVWERSGRELERIPRSPITDLIESMGER